jgi:hypothetical protein
MAVNFAVLLIEVIRTLIIYFFLDVLYGQYLSQQNNTLYEQANESLMLFFMVF